MVKGHEAKEIWFYSRALRIPWTVHTNKNEVMGYRHKHNNYSYNHKETVGRDAERGLREIDTQRDIEEQQDSLNS